jgi:hypothetical protein
MANADKKHHGPGVQGKGDGTGGMTNVDATRIPANSVLSNSDKAQHSEERGLDSAAVQTQQYQDHEDARLVDPDQMHDLPDEKGAEEVDLASAQLDPEGEGATAKIGDIVEDEP